jgi:hypothetical protein
MANRKEGVISQRVPKDTERKMKRLAKVQKIPEAVCLQLIIEEAYSTRFPKKSTGFPKSN